MVAPFLILVISSTYLALSFETHDSPIKACDNGNCAKSNHSISRRSLDGTSDIKDDPPMYSPSEPSYWKNMIPDTPPKKQNNNQYDLIELLFKVIQSDNGYSAVFQWKPCDQISNYQVKIYHEGHEFEGSEFKVYDPTFEFPLYWHGCYMVDVYAITLDGEKYKNAGRTQFLFVPPLRKGFFQLLWAGKHEGAVERSVRLPGNKYIKWNHVPHATYYYVLVIANGKKVCAEKIVETAEKVVVEVDMDKISKYEFVVTAWKYDETGHHMIGYSTAICWTRSNELTGKEKAQAALYAGGILAGGAVLGAVAAG